MIADIANVQIAVWPELNAVRFVELCFGCGATISAITWLACSSQRRNRSGLEVDFANRMVVHVDNEKVAGSIESNLMGQVETSENGWSSISAVTCHTVASDGADDSVL